MKIDEGTKLDFADILLKPKRSTICSRADVDITRTYKFRSGGSWTGIPIIAANMKSIVTYELIEAFKKHDMLVAYPKKLGWQLQRNTFYTYGINDYVAPTSGGFICFDVANGYQERFVDFIKVYRETSPMSTIIAGNVVSAEMTEALILAGTDIVKVGLGSGSACSTREIVGVGIPQASALSECVDSAHGLGAHIIADGGCKTPGDICKAFGIGADFVCIGGMLAGHRETGTEFYGESSKRANEERYGGLKPHRAAEGLELRVEPRGSLEDTLQQIEGGLRSACAYVGARRLKDLPKCATFIKVNRVK